jgi:ABC-type dipeptide/oligopeptide/nickel transport system permease subunit
VVLSRRLSLLPRRAPASQVEPSLGNLIGDAAATGIGAFNQLGLGWWVWVAPAVVLAAIVICVNLVGEGLDAALDPMLDVRS